MPEQSAPRRYANPGFPTFPHDAVDLLLIRHGESAALVEGETLELHEGHGNPPLSEKGHEQAARLAERLTEHVEGPPITAIYTSDLVRTLETAAPLADRLGLVPVAVPELREVHLGEWEGGLYRKMAAEGHPSFAEHLETGLWGVIPGAEADDDLRRRVRCSIDTIVGAHPGERVAVIVHGGIIGAALADVVGTDRSMWIGIDQTSINEVVAVNGRFVIRHVNDTAHLGDPLSLPVFNPA